jgi:hypothetical protein
VNSTSYLYGLSQVGEFGLQSVYYRADGAGSVRHLVDLNGAVKLARMYEPFGQVLMQTGTGDPIYGYLGAQFDRISDSTMDALSTTEAMHVVPPAMTQSTVPFTPPCAM